MAGDMRLFWLEGPSLSSWVGRVALEIRELTTPLTEQLPSGNSAVSAPEHGGGDSAVRLIDELVQQ